jgi:hypothetical protein
MLFTKATLRLVQGPVEGEVGWAGPMQYNPFCLTGRAGTASRVAHTLR